MTARILSFFTRANTDGRREAAERAFLPAALEIIESPASPTFRITAGMIGLFLTCAVLWSYFGHVDIVATAPGKVVALGGTKVIQPFETGVVRAIHVADGDKVQRGQILIELDTTVSDADRVRYGDMLIAARLDQARLNALIASTDSASDPFAGIGAPADLIAAARARLDADAHEQTAKLARLDRQAAEKRADEATTDAEIAKIDASLPLVQGRATIRQDSMKIEFGSKYEYLEAQQQVVELEHEKIVDQRKRDEADAALAEIAEQRAETEAAFRRTTLADLAKANHDTAEAQGELAKASKISDLETLTSPVDGVVQDLAVHTRGGVVTPAQQLLRIVPLTVGIEIEALIANQDVGFVSPGQEAEIKVETFPFTRYGLLRGQVREVAHDSVIDQQSEQNRQSSPDASDDPTRIEHSHQLIYTAHIALRDTSLMVDDHPYELTPGMAVTAEIKTGRRRVLDYLLSPLARYGHDTLRER